MRTKKSQYANIEYDASACFGFCPIFKLEINPDRTGVIDAEHFTFSNERSKNEFSDAKEGTFKTTLKEVDYNKLIQLLDALKLETLKGDYGNKNVSDLPTSNLTVNFANGSVKKIQDYGKHGKPELRKV